MFSLIRFRVEGFRAYLASESGEKCGSILHCERQWTSQVRALDLLVLVFSFDKSHASRTMLAV